MSSSQPGPLPRLLTIGAVAQRSGLATSAIRFYEAEGLIFAERTSGNQRRYPRHTLRRLAVIKAAQRMGIPLRQVKDAFSELPADRAPNSDEWQALSQHWQADLDARIATLQALRDGLNGCIACGCLSLARCPIYNPADARSAEGPGARELEALLPPE